MCAGSGISSRSSGSGSGSPNVTATGRTPAHTSRSWSSGWSIGIPVRTFTDASVRGSESTAVAAISLLVGGRAPGGDGGGGDDPQRLPALVLVLDHSRGAEDDGAAVVDRVAEHRPGGD